MRFINNGFIVLFLIFPFGRENERKREVKDERKFRYNVRDVKDAVYNDSILPFSLCQGKFIVLDINAFCRSVPRRWWHVA